MSSNLIIVNGLPATGKTSIAKFLSKKLEYVLLSKDSLKESLFDSLGVKDRNWSRDLGRVVYSLLYGYLDQLLSKNISVVVETNFNPKFDSARFQQLISQYNPKGIQIICHAEGTCLYERFIQRAESGLRHPGHCDLESKEEFKELLLRGKINKLELPFPFFEIDTTDWDKVKLSEVIQQAKRIIM